MWSLISCLRNGFENISHLFSSPRFSYSVLKLNVKVMYSVVLSISGFIVCIFIVLLCVDDAAVCVVCVCVCVPYPTYKSFSSPFLFRFFKLMMCCILSVFFRSCLSLPLYAS